MYSDIQRILFFLIILGSFLTASYIEAVEEVSIHTWPVNGKKCEMPNNKVLQVFPNKPIKELGECEASVAGTWEKDAEGYYAIFRSDSLHQNKWLYFVFRATTQDNQKIEERIKVQLATKEKLREKLWERVRDFLIPYYVRFDTKEMIKQLTTART